MSNLLLGYAVGSATCSHDTTPRETVCATTVVEKVYTDGVTPGATTVYVAIALFIGLMFGAIIGRMTSE